MVNQEKQETDGTVEEKHQSPEVLAILEQQKNLPKELSDIIEDYQQNQRTRTPNDDSEFIEAFKCQLFLLLAKDIYREGFEWCPHQVRTAMQLFPKVLPATFRDTTDHHIRDKAKMLSIFDHKNEFPHELESAIDNFKGDFDESNSTVPRQFLDHMQIQLRLLFKRPSQHQPHELRKAVQWCFDSYEKKASAYKIVSVLEKKNELPPELRQAIDNFEGNYEVSDWSNWSIPKQFFDYMNGHLISLFKIPNHHCQYDPIEFETALRLFPSVLDWKCYCVADYNERVERRTLHPICSIQKHKTYSLRLLLLLPMILEVCKDLRILRVHDDHDDDGVHALMDNALRILIFADRGEVNEPNRNELVEATCISLLEDIINRGLISKEFVVQNYFREVICVWCYARYKNRVRWFANSFPIEKRERFYKSHIRNMDCWVIYIDRFHLIMDVSLYWFPSEIGQIFHFNRQRYWTQYGLHHYYERNESKCDPIVFDLLDEHLTEATHQTKIDMIIYAASESSVPLKFLYFLLRREPHFLRITAGASQILQSWTNERKIIQSPEELEEQYNCCLIH